MQTCWRPLIDRVDLTCSSLCGMEAWKLIGAICTMIVSYIRAPKHIVA